MFLQQIEECVNLSIVGNHAQKIEASQYLHELKSRPDVISIGMNLVMSATRDDARLYGSHLVRDFLQSGRPMSTEECLSLRQVILEMVSAALQAIPGSAHALPAYLVNNLLYIISLCIKRDYPERWPTAFHDILHLGQTLGWHGVDVVIKVLNELEVEVVVYNEDRTRDEITHNTLIKDTMRGTSVIPDIVRFLRDAIQSAVSMHTTNNASANGSPNSTSDYLGVASRALLCLSSLIGWIDINLVIVELYPMIRSILEQPSSSTEGNGGLLCSEALLCVYEIVKKGMDPVLKADLLQRLDILPVLLKLLPRFQGSLLLYQVPEELEEMKLYHRRIAMVLDMLLVELLGVIIKYEDGLFPNSSKRNVTAFTTGRGRSVSTTNINGGNSSTVSAELAAVIPFVSHMLRLCIPEVINVLHHPVAMVAASVAPSIDRFLQFYKSQKGREVAIVEYLTRQDNNNGRVEPWFMVSQECSDALLVALWQQSQYPGDFALEDAAGDEADDEFMEAKIEVRRLLMNCARINVPRFLEMVTCFMAALPQPLSTAPIPAIDLCLHSLQSLDPTLVESSCPEAFHLLFSALTNTTTSDLFQHPHYLLQINFLEFAIRHWKKLQEATLLTIAVSIVTRIQNLVLFHSNSNHTHGNSTSNKHQYNSNSYGLPPKQVVVKLTHLALKITEVFPEKWKLLPIMALILKDTVILGTEANMHTMATTNTNNSRAASPNSNLFADIEVHLYEILGVLCAFVTSASAWQQFDVHIHASLFAQCISHLTATTTTGNSGRSSNSVTDGTIAFVTSLFPLLSSDTATSNGANSAATTGSNAGTIQYNVHSSDTLHTAAHYHSQCVQPLQLQLLALLTQHLQHHCQALLRLPSHQQSAFQNTLEAFFAQQMRNMIALLERFHKQYTNTPISTGTNGNSIGANTATISNNTSSYSNMVSESLLLPCLQQFSQLTMVILQNYPTAEVIRSRVYAFLRVMIVLVPNAQTFQYVGQMLPLLLQDLTSITNNTTSSTSSNGGNTSNGGFCGALEALVDLLNQVMTEFSYHSLVLVQTVASAVVSALWQKIYEACLLSAAVTSSTNNNANNSANSSTNATTSVLAAALLPDVNLPIKILLNFLVHVAQHRLMVALFPAISSSANTNTVSVSANGDPVLVELLTCQPSLSLIFTWLVPLMQGVVPVLQIQPQTQNQPTLTFVCSAKKIVKFTSLPFRRTAIVIFEHLLQHFILDRLPTTTTATTSSNNSTAASSAGNSPMMFSHNSNTSSNSLNSYNSNSNSSLVDLPVALQATTEQVYLLQVFLLEVVLPTALLCLGSSPGTQLILAQRHSTVSLVNCADANTNSSMANTSNTGNHQVREVSNMEYEHCKVNLQDAATQALLSEIAALLYLIVKVDQSQLTLQHTANSNVFGSNNCGWPVSVTVAGSGLTLSLSTSSAAGGRAIVNLSQQYLPWLLTQWLCWSPESMQMLCGTLYPANQPTVAVTMGTFREQFKQFVRQHLA